MKLFKTIDLFVQYNIAAVFLLAMVYFAITGSYDMRVIPYGYSAMGLWQLGSAFIHGLATGNYYREKTRSVYIISVIIFLLILFTGYSVIPHMAWIMIIVSPGLATWYLVISYRELVLLQKKSLIHLKR